MTILDTTWHGRHVRIVTTDDDESLFWVILNGRVYPGFTSRVDALAAARALVRS